ncbi:MAG: Crp/Fnr family transcriptional regulator [Clostridia bacterium]|nr:Crp/Fnr family transcriptional regulator [Clostridia bacterium]
MNADAAALKKTRLFGGINEREFSELLAYLAPRCAEYDRGEYLPKPETTRAFGLVLSGAVLLLRDDRRGDRNLILRASAGDTFWESQAICQRCADLDAVAEEKARVFWISAEKAAGPHIAECAGYCRFTRNLLSAVAEKELVLCEKITHMGRRTTRQKLMSFLESQSRSSGSRVFDIPFSRQQLADYLSVDRSAMSAELSALARGGMIKYERSHFELL